MRASECRWLELTHGAEYDPAESTVVAALGGLLFAYLETKNALLEDMEKKLTTASSS